LATVCARLNVSAFKLRTAHSQTVVKHFDKKMKETKTETDLKKYCKQIIDSHQEEFEEIFNGEYDEYDSFIKYSDLTQRLQTSLELAVNKFNPKVITLLQVKYVRLLQYSIMLDGYVDFVKKNTPTLEKKFNDIDKN
tara:strand:+ start:1054 stop:1464 length:411 start_codon:yes stop_codon:yes gene_type:complete